MLAGSFLRCRVLSWFTRWLFQISSPKQKTEYASYDPRVYSLEPQLLLVRDVTVFCDGTCANFLTGRQLHRSWGTHGYPKTQWIRTIGIAQITHPSYLGKHPDSQSPRSRPSHAQPNLGFNHFSQQTIQRIAFWAILWVLRQADKGCGKKQGRTRTSNQKYNHFAEQTPSSSWSPIPFGHALTCAP